MSRAMSETHLRHSGVEPLLLTARQAAAVCGRSLRTWRSWDSSGRIPRPIRIGSSTLWRAVELQAWVDAGCPSREEWETRQAEARPR
jgi:predicted DNA-binding transcriptional regulator AlpA